MKYGLLLVISLVTALQSAGQQTLRLTLEWNAQSSRYEVFALPGVTQKNAVLGKAQVSLVVPKAAPDSRLNVTSFAGGTWVDEKFITDPASAAGRDFHAVTSVGGVVQFTAGQKILLFSFTFPDGQCRDGVRLYNNGGDPAGNGAGFNGIDFTNSILGGGNIPLYHSNVSNSGATCMDCPVEFNLPKLKKQS